jgi:hypothetical protein
LLVWIPAWAWRTNELPGKRRAWASSLTSHDNQGTSAFKHGRAYDRFQRGPVGDRGVPELRAGEVDEATPRPKDAPGHRPGPRKGGERSGEAGIDPPTQLLGSSYHDLSVRESQLLDGELEEGGSLGPALDEQDPDQRLRDGDDDAGQPCSGPEIAGDIVLVHQRRCAEAIEDVAIPDARTVRTRDGTERDRSTGQEILVPEEGSGLRGAERESELSGLPDQDLRVAHRCFT